MCISDLSSDVCSSDLHGRLLTGVTRGDGVRGDDVTNNVKTIRRIPLVLRGKDIPDSFEVRGDVFMPKEIFLKLNKNSEDIGEERYAHARNTERKSDVKGKSLSVRVDVGGRSNN